MGLRPQLLEMPIAERFSHDAAQNAFFVNIE